jgi:hypothetical protein
MPYGDNITEGLPLTLSNPVAATFTNSSELFDVAINGQPFFLGVRDDTPYRRVTAKYRKDQYDTTREPGEQSLTGWWLRSQSSFHMGSGIKFFEPLQDELLRFRTYDSRGVDVWTQGQVTLLHDTYTAGSYTTPQIVGCVFEDDALLVSDDDSLHLIYADGSTGIDYTDVSSPTTILSLTTDGSRYFYLNGTRVVRGNISSSSAGTAIYSYSSSTSGLLRYVKQRLIAAVDASIYELNPNASASTAMPTAFFTAPQPDWEWTAIAEGPQAIYIAGYSGTSSSVFKITLDVQTPNALGFPELNVPTVVADFPAGEYVKAFDVYLGTYAVIVTNKGVRIGVVGDGGDLAYGPLLFEDADCTGIAFRDRFAYVSTTVDGEPGLVRIDLSMPTSTSSYVFAYACDLVASGESGKAYGVAFYGTSDKAAFTTTTAVWAESDTDYVPDGWLRTGYIRYNMLDGKIFKYIFPRVDTTNGGLIVESVDSRNVAYSLVTYPQGGQVSEANVAFPTGPQEYLGFKFTLTAGDDITKSPVFTGYQTKSLPAIPRQRMIQYPLFCFDREADSLNNQIGYEGYAAERLFALESLEDSGDTVRVQDFRTGESFIGLIEEVDFINQTPADKRYSGFGGLILVTVRKVS